MPIGNPRAILSSKQKQRYMSTEALERFSDLAEDTKNQTGMPRIRGLRSLPALITSINESEGLPMLSELKRNLVGEKNVADTVLMDIYDRARADAEKIPQSLFALSMVLLVVFAKHGGIHLNEPMDAQLAEYIRDTALQALQYGRFFGAMQGYLTTGLIVDQLEQNDLNPAFQND